MTDFAKHCLVIAKTQSDVNDKMAGADWIKEAQDPNGRINYKLAILDELAEYMRSAIAFKWWAKTTTDVSNAKLELVDILHFLTSWAIVQTGSVEKAAEVMSESLDYVEEDKGNYTEKDCLLNFINLLYAPTADKDDVLAIFTSFWSMCACHTYPLEIVACYRAKAVLNKFRTDNGQKEGKYKKIWFEGREDNDFVMAFLRERMADTAEYPGDEAMLQYMNLTYPRG